MSHTYANTLTHILFVTIILPGIKLMWKIVPEALFMSQEKLGTQTSTKREMAEYIQLVEY